MLSTDLIAVANPNMFEYFWVSHRLQFGPVRFTLVSWFKYLNAESVQWN